MDEAKNGIEKIHEDKAKLFNDYSELTKKFQYASALHLALEDFDAMLDSKGAATGSDVWIEKYNQFMQFFVNDLNRFVQPGLGNDNEENYAAIMVLKVELMELGRKCTERMEQTTDDPEKEKIMNETKEKVAENISQLKKYLERYSANLGPLKDEE